MTVPDARAAVALEQALGAAHGPDASLDADEREAFPEPLVSALTRAGLLRHFVPRRDGGALGSFVEAALMMRVAARRDLTAAIAMGQAFLGSVPLWLRGDPAQRERQAKALLGGQLAALALTEEAHGSDLLACDTRVDQGRLTGTKWLINNATRGELLTVLARTREPPGLGSFTLVHFDKTRARGFTCLPRLRTHGIRGADISGINFDCPLGPEAFIGNEGSGIELTLKALQVTRIGCAAFSLGAADTALRLALDFALERKLYAGTAFDIPHVRAVLTTAWLDLLIAEAVALGAWRGLHLAPEQMSLASAVVKYFVPTRVELLIRDCAVVLGARHWLRAGPFQKVMRDASVVSLFDGSTAVNLEGIALQLNRLRRVDDPRQAERARARFDAAQALPDFSGEGLELIGPGHDDVLHGCARLEREIDALERPARQQRRSARAFEVAEQAAVLYAAASCVHLQPAWLEAALERLLGGGLCDDDRLTQAMLAQHRERAWFSGFAIPLQ